MPSQDANKARRRAVLGRVCQYCYRDDSEVTWSNRKDVCTSCDRTRPRVGSADQNRPSVEAIAKLYESNGKLERFHSKAADLDDSGLLRSEEKDQLSPSRLEG